MQRRSDPSFGELDDCVDLLKAAGFSCFQVPDSLEGKRGCK